VPLHLQMLLSRKHRPSLIMTVVLAALCALQSSAVMFSRMLQVEVRHSFDNLYGWALARFLTALAVPLGAESCVCGCLCVSMGGGGEHGVCINVGLCSGSAAL
jgi:hypothetical protein